MESAQSEIKAQQIAIRGTFANFLSEATNYVASIRASVDAVRMEGMRLDVACTNSIAMLTSSQMESAIKNAERLATALKAISELRSHSITFAVLDTKPPTEKI